MHTAKKYIACLLFLRSCWQFCTREGGRQVTLTVDDEVGWALFETSAWSDEENE